MALSNPGEFRLTQLGRAALSFGVHCVLRKHQPRDLDGLVACLATGADEILGNPEYVTGTSADDWEITWAGGAAIHALAREVAGHLGAEAAFDVTKVLSYEMARALDDPERTAAKGGVT